MEKIKKVRDFTYLYKENPLKVNSVAKAVGKKKQQAVQVSLGLF